MDTILASADTSESDCASREAASNAALPHVVADTKATSKSMTDSEVAAAVDEAIRSGNELLVVASAFTVRLCTRPNAATLWSDIGGGDFGTLSLAAAGPAIKQRRLWWSSVAVLPSTVPDVNVGATPATSADVRRWVREADSLTTSPGRKGEASPKTCEEVARLAAWHCQFLGCGKDLRRHTATGAAGRFSYFAHIVASSPDGPRGNASLSHRLADDPTNFLLLCDECHRLIDRVNPGFYTVDLLRSMREQNIAEVNRLLNTLRFAAVEVVAIVGNVAGQPAQFTMTDAQEALWNSELRPAGAEPEWLFQNGGHLHDPFAAGYWDSMFAGLTSDLVTLQRLLNGRKRGGGPRPPIAVFPLHSTSTLILAGRVLGDTSNTHLFQPHRTAIGALKTSRWAWPEHAETPPDDKYKMRVLRDRSADGKDACLIVSLTTSIAHRRLTAACYDGNDLVLPTIEVSVDSPSHSTVGHPRDLQLLGLRLDEALRVLQDQWRAKRIHLFMLAPTTAAVRIGQKMQARHHATFVCHETRGVHDGPFSQTIEISTTHVSFVGSQQTLSLQP